MSPDSIRRSLVDKPTPVREPSPEEFVALKRDAAQNVLNASKALQGDTEALRCWRSDQHK